MKNHTSTDAFYERMRTLADVNKNSIKESQNRGLGTLIDYKRAADGVAYGIIKENHHYYVKKGGIKNDPNVADFAYIGGLENLTNFQYKSLAEADKQRNMLFHTINEAVSLRPSNNGSKKRLNEDRAGEEIGSAEEKLGDLDAATAAADSADVPLAPDNGDEEMAAGLQAEPTGGEMPDMGGEEEMPDMGGEEEIPDMGGEEVPEVPADDANKELEKGIGKITNTIRKTELEPAQIKSYLKSFIQAFKDKLPELEIEERKDIANLIIKIVPPEDIADLEGNVDDTDAEEVEEETCSECGRFTEFAKSRGYDSAEALMECGEEEVTNLVSGYANAHNDGMNDGDVDGVALVIKIVNPEILNKLKSDYGHDDYAQKLEPQVNAMSESTEEENIAKLNELFGGLGALGRAAGSAIGKGVSAVGKGIGNAAVSAGQAVGGAVQRGAQAVGNAATGAAQAVGQAGQRVGQAVQQGAEKVSQTYHGGEVSGEVKRLEGLANDLGSQVAALNTRLKKAGQEEVNVQKLIAGITNQVRSGKGASVAGTTAGAGIQKENTDPAYTETQPLYEEDDDDCEGEYQVGTYDGEYLFSVSGKKVVEVPDATYFNSCEEDEMNDFAQKMANTYNEKVRIYSFESGSQRGFDVFNPNVIKEADNNVEDNEGDEDNFFAPAAQSLGVGVVKPDGAPTTISVTSQNGTKVDVGLNEVFKQLRKAMNEAKAKNNVNEISTGLADKASNAAWKATSKAQNNRDSVGSSVKQSQARKFNNYINPQIRGMIQSQLNPSRIIKYDGGIFVGLNSAGGEVGIMFTGECNGYEFASGNDASQLDQNTLRKIKYLVPKIAADFNSQKKAPNELEESKKPSQGLSKEKKSEVVKSAKKGEDIGKKGKGFEKVADKASKEYGSKEAGKKVAAAAMWKNVKREGKDEKKPLTESEAKLRKYIRNRLMENAGTKKATLNENQKSPTLKKLDEAIDKQFKLYGNNFKKK